MCIIKEYNTKKKRIEAPGNIRNKNTLLFFNVNVLLSGTTTRYWIHNNYLIFI